MVYEKGTSFCGILYLTTMTNSDLRKKLTRSAKELKKYLTESEEFRRESIDRAFIFWYLKARFGNNRELFKNVVDGANDGGIDAYVVSEARREIEFFQFKYEKEPRLSSLKRDELAGFEKIQSIICDDSSHDFDDWIGSVRSELQKVYIELSEKIKRKKYKAKFVIVTTKAINFTSSKIVGEDVNKTLSLWELYQEGFTPPAETLNIRLKNPITVEEDRYTTYVGLAEISDFKKAMAKDVNERLFAQNVRTDLKSNINENIKETYEKESEFFWLGNNGLYIVCKDVSSTGNSYTLVYPSIINGSQTLHSIAESKKDHECKILIRILKLNFENDDDKTLLNNIIRRTNSQNAMNQVNLYAHDTCQLNIARFLQGYRIFYERREKEWKNEKKLLLSGFAVVNIKELSQWLSVLHSEIGLGPARTNVASLFHETNYKLIFNDYSNDRFDSLGFSNLIPLVWSGVFTKNLVKNLDGDEYVSRAKIAQLFLIKMLYKAVHDDRDIVDIIRTKKLILGEFGKKNIPRDVKRVYKNVIDKLIAFQSNEQKKNPKLDFSNFFKRKELPESAYKKIVTSSFIKQLHAVIEKSLKEIY